MAAIFPFGSGRLYLDVRDAVPNGDILRVGVAALQDITWSFAIESRELYGQNRYPVDIRLGMGRVEGTARTAEWEPEVINQLVDGTLDTQNKTKIVYDQEQTPDAMNNNTVTIAGFAFDLGVKEQSDGSVLTRVSGTPQAGQYKLDQTTGTYTFADTNPKLMSYAVDDATNGSRITIDNDPMGRRLSFKGLFINTDESNDVVLELEYIVPSGFNTAARVSDWMNLDVPLRAYADPITGRVGRLSIGPS